MPPRIVRFFNIIGVPVIGSYGSTECGGMTLCGIGNAKPGSLGKPFPNVELRLADDGRKKDIFNCADGSNIYPGNIEALLENDSFIRQAVLLGDHRPFIAALIVPDRCSITAALGRTRTSLSDGDIETVLRQRVDLINNQLDDYQKIRKVAVLSDDFPESIRSIAALQKIKIDRQAVEEGYRKEAADS